MKDILKKLMIPIDLFLMIAFGIDFFKYLESGENFYMILYALFVLYFTSSFIAGLRYLAGHEDETDEDKE